MNPLLYYECISEFKRQYYSSLISHEHLVEGEVKLDKLSYPDGGTDERANFWGWKFEKDGVKYLVESKGKKLKDLCPFMAMDCQKVAHAGQVYQFVGKVVPARFKSEKTMTFKELVDSFASHAHTNPQHQKLWWFLSLSAMMDRTYFRVASNPGFGKDSVVDILGHLIGGAGTVENPTLAKLEYLTYLKWLAVSEIVDISKTEWRVIEQFLLAAGAHKPEVTKHSRAKDAVQEILNLNKFSLSLIYNDIDNYPEMEKYFDFVTKDAVKDRYPAFRVWGTLTEDFNQVRTIDVPKFVKEHHEDYRKIIYAFTYYKDNVMRELKRWNADKLSLMIGNKKMPERWKISLGKILRIIDLYCSTQEEFDEWMKVIGQVLVDYQVMLEYPNHCELLARRMGKGTKDYLNALVSVHVMPTFTSKIQGISEIIHARGAASTKSKGVWAAPVS